MAARRCLLALAVLVSACAAMQVPPRAAPVEDEQSRLLGGGRHAANASVAKTMAVKGHTVSEASASWTGRVVYGVLTAAIPRKNQGVLAQLDTWAARPAAQGRYVAVGGNNYPEEWQGSNVLRSECGDDYESISCKEATLLAEGAARGPDWLYVIGEDNYVHTGHVEKFLRDKDPDAAVAYGGVGCGKGMYCSDVKAFEEGGGFCGGSGYFISRAALRLLLADGAPALHAIYDRTAWPGDMTTSCQLRKHEVRLADGPDRGMFGNIFWSIRDYKVIAHSGFLSAHYITPAVMRWLHAEVGGAAKSVKRPLQEKAFDKGCAIGLEDKDPGGELAACQAAEGGRKQ